MKSYRVVYYRKGRVYTIHEGTQEQITKHRPELDGILNHYNIAHMGIRFENGSNITVDLIPELKYEDIYPEPNSSFRRRIKCF